MSLFNAPIHIFEHGMDAQCSRIICSVEHAHQHFVPANVDVWDSLKDGIVWSQVPLDLSDFRNAIGDREYLLYIGPDHEPIVAFGDRQYFESQYIRKIFAKALNKPDKWDWKQYPFYSDIVTTYNILKVASNEQDRREVQSLDNTEIDTTKVSV